MAEGTQKLNAWGGLHLEKDNMEIGDSQSPDCSNTLVDVYGKLRSRPGYTKYNTTAYANPVTGLYDYAGLATYSLQTVSAAGSWLATYISGTNIYIVNTNISGVTAYVDKPNTTSFNPSSSTWHGTAISANFPSICADVTNINIPFVNTTADKIQVLTTTIADLTVHSTVDTNTGIKAYSVPRIVSDGTSFYVGYIKLDAGAALSFVIDKGNTGFTVVTSNLVNQALTGTVSTGTQTPANLSIVGTTIYFDAAYGSSANVHGSVETDGSALAYTEYAVSAQMISSIVSGGSRYGILMKSISSSSKSFYFFTIANNGSARSVAALPLVTATMNIGSYDCIPVQVYASKLYFAYLDSNQLKIGYCSLTGTNFKTITVDIGVCTYPNMQIVGTQLLVSYITLSGGSYYMNLYTRNL
jgi:hypothetical protein